MRTIDPEPDHTSLLNDTNSIERSESDANLVEISRQINFNKKYKPMKVSGRKLIDDNRKVLWR